MTELILAGGADFNCSNMPRLLNVLKANNVKNLVVRLSNHHAQKTAAEKRFAFTGAGFKVLCTVLSPIFAHFYTEAVQTAHIFGTKYIDITALIAKKNGVTTHMGAAGKAKKFVANSAGIPCVFKNSKGDTVKRCQKLCGSVGRGLQLAFDVTAFAESGIDPVAAYTALSDHVAYICLDDKALEHEGLEALLSKFGNKPPRNEFAEDETKYLVLGVSGQYPDIPEEEINRQSVDLKAALCASGYEQSKDMAEGFAVWRK